MKLGGLFSGIGGFELAWTRLGGQVAWMCEVDPKARKVLEARFPGVPIYPDVQELDPAEVEAVDVLTGGSPCQGFSVAGQRQGLLHGESRLFADYVRIMDGLAARGLQYALWENVPGVLSIKNPDGERTFPHVIGALAGGSTAVRLDPRRKWNVGLVADGGRAVAWRVLDSRYFGVAQRRRRVFACVAFGDSAADRAGRALLAVAEGVRGDSAAGGQEGEGAAGGVAGGVGGPSGVAHTLTNASSKGATEDGTGRGTPLVPDRPGVPSVTGAVTSKWAKGTGGPSGDEAQNLVADQPQAFNLMPESKQGKWLTANETDLSMSLPTTYPADRGVRVVEPQAFRKSRRPQSATDDETWVDDGQANTLNVFDVGDTRTTHAIVEPTPLQDTREVEKKQNGLGVGQPGDPSFTLDTTSRAGFGAYYGVRRLTPVECERLQAFPDGWTEPAGSDSARYKALGNAVTVNTVGWILRRIKALM